MATQQIVLFTGAMAMTSVALAADQEAPAEPQTGTLEEIIVTAQKRDQSLQRVPIAVSAYSGEDRELLGLSTAQDLSNFTPGVQWEYPSPNRFTIRGIGRQTGAIGTDPGVAAYYDGFYAGDPGSAAGGAGGSIGAPRSIERVEILRGPQGTLFGRNSIGGAVNSVSRRPYDHFETEVTLSAATYDTLEAAIDITGPVSDRVRMRGSISRDYRGQGYVENVGGPEVDKHDSSWGGELQVEADLTDDVQFWAKYATATFDWTFAPELRIDPYDTDLLSTGLVPNPTYAYDVPNPTVADHREVSQDYAGLLELDGNHQVVAHLDWDFGSTKLKYITGYQTYDVAIGIDGDGTNRTSYTRPCATLAAGCFVSTERFIYIDESHEQWSNEINWSSSDDASWRWILGLFQFHENVAQDLSLTSPFQPELLTPFDFATFSFLDNPTGEYFASSSELETDAYAIYGQTDIDLSDEWTVQIGARYSIDEKRGQDSIHFALFDPDTDLSALGITGPVALDLGSMSLDHDTEDWEGVTGRFALQWQARADTMVYGSVSTGFKSGGMNLGAMTLETVDSESVVTYELGTKMLLASTFRVNTALFYNDYRDLQIPVQLCVGDAGCPTTISTLVNAPESRSYGFEMETTWAPTDSLQLIANYAYLNAEFEELCCVVDDVNPAAGGQDLAGEPLPFSPEHKIALNVLYQFQLGDGDMAVSASYSWVDEQYYSLFSTPIFRGDERNNLDLRATWTSMSGAWAFIAFIDNVTDEAYNVGAHPASAGVDNARVWTLNPPRVTGLRVRRIIR